MPKVPDNPKRMAVGAVSCCALLFLAGCQRRAYTDLYVQNMASEIRELEDRIYEYDAAYQGMEGELHGLQSENQQLHQKLMRMQSEPQGSRSLFKGFNGPGSEMHSVPSQRSSEGERVNPKSSIRVLPEPDPVPNIVPSPLPKKSSETTAPSIDNLPSSSEKAPSKKENAAPKVDTNDLEPPRIELGSPAKSILPPSGGLPPNTDSSPPMPNTDGLLPPPVKNGSLPPPNAGTHNRSPIHRDRQVAIDTTENRMEPSASEIVLAGTQASEGLPGRLDADAIDAGRIDIPIAIQPAVHQRTASSDSNTSSNDTKIVEIAFHPTLCRGQYLNAEDDNDGLYLVLQPRNRLGESIDHPASVTIVALDPNRTEGDSRIGRWTLTAEEVDAALEPIGVSHGYHLALPWQQAKPSGDAVQVYVRYEMDDSRRLVNERRIQLHVPTNGSAAWTPRVAK